MGQNPFFALEFGPDSEPDSERTKVLCVVNGRGRE